MREPKEQQRRESFWTWFLRSGRRDGTDVGKPRRVLSVVVTLAIAAALYAGTVALGTALRPDTRRFRQFAISPLFIVGFLVALALLVLRYAALDYMAFSVYEREKAELLRDKDESQLRNHYEAKFGRDTVYRAPEAAGVIALLVFAAVAVTMVFWQ